MESGSPLPKILFLGKYQFYLELLIPFLILMLLNKKRKYFYISLVAAIIVPCFLYFVPTLIVGTYNFNYLLSALVVFLFGFLLYDESFLTLLCAVTIAFGVQHISWNFLAFIYDLFPNNGGDLSFVAVVIIFICSYLVTYLALFFTIYFLKRPYRYQKKDSLSIIFGTIIIFIAAILSQYVKNWDLVYRLYTLILMLLGIALEFVIPVAHEAGSKAKALEDEKSTLMSLLELQAKQNETSKKEQEILNLKIHDIKHQLIAYKSATNDQKDVAINELEKMIDIYGDYAKTGNNTIDIVLTQKALYCTKENITLTYIIDGPAFSFMEVSDILSLFGNIIDNAIEAVKNEEKENRLIKISASIKNGFLSLLEENYTSKKIKFTSNGLPLSTKENQIYHGFGSKSIKYITSKYGGAYSFEQKGDKFILSLIFPIKK